MIFKELFRNQALFLFIFITHCFFSTNLQAQNNAVVKGKIVDAQTFEPVSFASIIINKNPKKGVISDIDGKFSIKATEPLKYLTISSMGYRLTSVMLDTIDVKSPFIINLNKDTVYIEEVKIKPGENPAHRIINKAIANRNDNNPDKYTFYKCRIYNKTSMDLKPNRELMDEKMYKRIKKIQDTTHILMFETMSDRYYQSPNNIKEIINASRVSGFSNPSFSFQSTDIQPFHFYNEYLELYNYKLLNPISKNSTAHYFFEIKDTLFRGNDSVFVISFRPRKGSNINGLEGVIYINTNKYAIQNIKATPYDKRLLTLSIEQQYQYIDSLWFPKELNFSIILPQYPRKDMGMAIIGKSYIDSVTFANPAKPLVFNEMLYEYTDTARQASAAYWDKTRPMPLDEKEQRTYTIMDSVGKARHFDKVLYIVEKLFVGTFPYKCFDFGLPIKLNNVENYRLEANIHTNEKIFKHFVVGGYTAYGVEDKMWKYGGDAAFKFGDAREQNIRVAHCLDIKEPGYEDHHFDDLYPISRYFLMSHADKIEETRLSTNLRIKYLQIYLSGQQQVTSPLSSAVIIPDKLKFAEANISLRYCYKERYAVILGRKVPVSSENPLVFINYSRGFDNILDGNYAYDKIWGSIEKTFTIRNFGETEILLEGGYSWGNIPYPKLYGCNGSYLSDNPWYTHNSFQTMGLYEFSSNRYVHLLFSHNFKQLIIKTKHFAPEIIAINNIGYGKLNQSITGVKDYQKGYFEGGILVNNIVKFNIMNFFYLGIGGGVFCKYGYYASPTLNDNLAAKLNLTLLF